MRKHDHKTASLPLHTWQPLRGSGDSSHQDASNAALIFSGVRSFPFGSNLNLGVSSADDEMTINYIVLSNQNNGNQIFNDFEPVTDSQEIDLNFGIHFWTNSLILLFLIQNSYFYFYFIKMISKWILIYIW